MLGQVTLENGITGALTMQKTHFNIILKSMVLKLGRQMLINI